MTGQTDSIEQLLSQSIMYRLIAPSTLWQGFFSYLPKLLHLSKFRS